MRQSDTRKRWHCRWLRRWVGECVSLIKYVDWDNGLSTWEKKNESLLHTIGKKKSPIDCTKRNFKTFRGQREYLYKLEEGIDPLKKTHIHTKKSLIHLTTLRLGISVYQRSLKKEWKCKATQWDEIFILCVIGKRLTFSINSRLW